MDLAVILNGIVYVLDVAFLGFLAYGAHLVLGGGGFPRDAPEDATQPRSDLAHFR